jgi:hypothetical protein
MEVKINKLTNIELAHQAIKSTINSETNIKSSLSDIYSWDHSIARTQLFFIQMIAIPTLVSVHIVRHKIGVEHFVKSNRIDRGGNSEATRHTLINHSMLINAEAILTMAKARLCFKASKETRELICKIKKEMEHIDYELATVMLPKCFHQGMICKEPKPCGKYAVKKWKSYLKELPQLLI